MRHHSGWLTNWRKLRTFDAVLEFKYADKNFIRFPRQEVAFLEECRKINGCGSLAGDFYTRFKPKNKGFGAVTWLEKRKGICPMADSFF